ncbi:hypothetical protein HPP92_014921 [Vanilla planifolia]|uniref:Pentatricopeptide repeat-containing protein n=1 Tax=Vanilla planifolia TaxID=51239 RepID=A0A835URJ7_VANPL|nr:hypothetical protein HPP92_014921 [Vanilla planifolia]
MEMKGISLDVVGFSAYINGLCRANCVEKAFEAFWKMRSGGLVPNNFIYNSLISGLFRIGDIKEALKLEAEMKFNGLTPDIFTTNIVINGFCEARCLEGADEKFKKMGWNGMQPDIVTYNTLIALCYKAFDIERAERYFKIMSFNCKPDVFTYNIRIHGLFSNYKVTEAIKTLDKLLSEDFAPNSVTHNTVMNAICVDDLGRAMILAAKLIKMALVPNVVTVNLLLSHFCKQGLVESALMWEKFKKVYNFDNVTLHILDKASVLKQTSFKSSSNVESGKDLFLEFLMHITFELLCNSSDSSKHKPLAIKGLVGNGLQKIGLGMKGSHETCFVTKL